MAFTRGLELEVNGGGSAVTRLFVTLFVGKSPCIVVRQKGCLVHSTRNIAIQVRPTRNIQLIDAF